MCICKIHTYMQWVCKYLHRSTSKHPLVCGTLTDQCNHTGARRHASKTAMVHQSEPRAEVPAAAV